MRIATWNINSVRTRVDRAVAFLERNDIDVLAMQETKCSDDKFPYSAFEAAGYEVAHVGYHQWNGVALISRVGLEDVKDHFPNQPGFDKDPAKPQNREARAVGATCNGVEIWSLYVPNGREIADPHYDYKLEFLWRLGEVVDKQKMQVLCGDFNIAPTDKDVWERAFFEGKTHVTEPERAAFQRVVESGLTQVRHEEPYSYFDYKGARFLRGEGMLIDFQLASSQLPARAWVDLEERAGEKASDHAPVIADYDLSALLIDEVR